MRDALKTNFGDFHEVSQPTEADLQWADYEELDFQGALTDEKKWICAYSIRKALIRKQFLSQTVREYVAKNPDSILKSAVPESFQLELDYVEFLDDALDEAFELRGELEANSDKDPSDRKWFILKPSMAERGAGIRLFSTIEELTCIFEENEDDSSDEGDDSVVTSDDDDDSGSLQAQTQQHSGVMTSDMRFFVVQEYLSRPLLLHALQGRKFHLRVYIFCIGSISVYIHRNVLVLSSAEVYSKPSYEQEELAKHLTNTCYQVQSNSADVSPTLVHSFWELKDPVLQHEAVWTQLKAITADLFKAASAQRINFQTLPNAFEVFGVDFLVDEENSVHLLEVNAYPDFGQTGEEHKNLVDVVATDMVTLVARHYKRYAADSVSKRTPSHGDGSAEANQDPDMVGSFERCLCLGLL